MTNHTPPHRVGPVTMDVRAAAHFRTPILRSSFRSLTLPKPPLKRRRHELAAFLTGAASPLVHPAVTTPICTDCVIESGSQSGHRESGDQTLTAPRVRSRLEIDDLRRWHHLDRITLPSQTARCQSLSVAGLRLHASANGTLSPQNFSISGRASVENPVERNLRRPAYEPSYSGCRSR